MPIKTEKCLSNSAFNPGCVLCKCETFHGSNGIMKVVKYVKVIHACDHATEKKITMMGQGYQKELQNFSVFSPFLNKANNVNR